jgi:hypothetical protein
MLPPGAQGRLPAERSLHPVRCLPPPSALHFTLGPRERGPAEPLEAAMTDAIGELKVRAEILHRRIQARDARALARLRALPPLRRAAERELLALADAIQRRHCLAVVAAELGFPDWPAARRVLSGEDAAQDFGTLLCPPRCGGHVNRWYARYEDASAVRRGCRGYLLAYRRQYLVVERGYIESLGLDPDDPDWERLGFDWVRPRDVGARSRLYAKLVARLPREAA